MNDPLENIQLPEDVHTESSTNSDEAIVAQRRGPKIIFWNGYSYISSTNNRGWRYLKCRKHFQECPATGKVPVDGDEEDFVPHRPHNHPPDETDNLINRFRQALKEACQTQPGNLRDTYEVTAVLNLEAAAHQPYEMVKQSMRRWKLCSYPPIPGTLEEASVFLQNPQYARMAGTRHGQYYAAFVDGHPNGSANHNLIAEYFSASEEMFVDATFKVTPRTPMVRQLLTIFGVHQGYALYKNARRLGVTREIWDSPERQALLRKYYALDLLPPQLMLEGLNYLQTDQLQNIFAQFHAYVENFWYNKIGTQHCSVFGQKHRTNNILETYHSRLNRKVGTQHPGIWRLLEVLLKIEEPVELELRQVDRVPRLRRVARPVHRQFEHELDVAWQRLATGIIGVPNFLVKLQHFIKTLHNRLHNWVPLKEGNENVDLNFPNLDPFVRHPQEIQYPAPQFQVAMPSPAPDRPIPPRPAPRLRQPVPAPRRLQSAV